MGVVFLLWRGFGSSIAPSDGRPALGPAPAGTIPYEIIEKGEDYTKEVLFVRLARKPPKNEENELVAIARELHSRSLRPRTVVWFTLRDGNPRSNPWARVDFDPEVKPYPQVYMMGLTVAEEDELIRRPLPPDSTDLIGRWIDGMQGKSLYTIFRSGDKIWLERAGEARSEGTRQELVELERGGLRQFHYKKDPRENGLLVLNGYGDLEFRDDSRENSVDERLFFVARRVK